MKEKITKYFVITTFVSLYLLVSLISMIHSIEFFKLSNSSDTMAVVLGIAFEIGAAASLAAIIVLNKLTPMSKFIVWLIFIVLTLMQSMSNAYFAYVQVTLHDYHYWSELFSLTNKSPMFQKRILSIISGAILPLIALGFIKSLVDYMRPNKELINTEPPKEVETNIDTDIPFNSNQEEPVTTPETNEQPISTNVENNDDISSDIKDAVIHIVEPEIVESVIENTNEPTIIQDAIIDIPDEIQIPIKKRGRPVGSKNKPKIEIIENTIIDEPIINEEVVQIENITEPVDTILPNTLKDWVDKKNDLQTPKD